LILCSWANGKQFDSDAGRTDHEAAPIDTSYIVCYHPANMFTLRLDKIRPRQLHSSVSAHLRLEIAWAISVDRVMEYDHDPHES